MKKKRIKPENIVPTLKSIVDAALKNDTYLKDERSLFHTPTPLHDYINLIYHEHLEEELEDKAKEKKISQEDIDNALDSDDPIKSLSDLIKKHS